MRRFAIAIVLSGMVAEACTGDAWIGKAWAGDFELPDAEMPVLRGSSPFIPAPPIFTRWSGYYVGGQVGYGSANMDFAGATQSLFEFMFRELKVEQEAHPSQWDVLGSKATGSITFGGFVGYNSQWDDVVLGIDAHYSAASFSAVATSSPIGRSTTTSNGNIYNILLDGGASMHITDWGAVRLRAGYVMGPVLPYVTAGFAFGRADITRSARMQGTETIPQEDPDPDIVTPFSDATSESKKGAFIYGWTVGAGVDYLITSSLFVRGEVEYADFAKVSGIKASIATARLGAGLRF